MGFYWICFSVCKLLAAVVVNGERESRFQGTIDGSSSGGGEDGSGNG